MAEQQSKIKIGFKQAVGLLGPYIKNKIVEQIKSVLFIVLYLIVFQILVLRMPIEHSAMIAAGLAIVVLGLAFFMEGLLLGLMPLGESIGLRLPQKAKLPIILIFAFILGFGVTLAEPAVGVLKTAGESVKAWDAPLLFLILNKYSNYLVYAVGIGVGIAVFFGVLRFLYNWSLKPFLYIMTIFLTGFSIWAYLEPNMVMLTGLAWDCGGVTTGPVTVPLVLALGIGICRVSGTAKSGTAGFGIVTLASIFPVLTVLLLGQFFVGSVPKPMSEAEFFSVQNKAKVEFLFNQEEEKYAYAFKSASDKGLQSLFDGSEQQMDQYLLRAKADKRLKKAVFGETPEAMEKWVIKKGTNAQQLAVFGTQEKIKEAILKYSKRDEAVDWLDVFKRNTLASVQAIVSLSVFLLLVFLVLIREKLPRPDEMFLGIFLAVIGMLLFSVGIEVGLGKIGAQAGEKVPASFKAIEMVNEKKIISNFEEGLVQRAITAEGKEEKFFYTKSENEYQAIPFQEKNYDVQNKQYSYTPTKGPLFGEGFSGMLVVLIFAFLMGYGATLAEPALNALGLKVEELTVGTFKKSLLMQTVAIGVGVGIAFGVAKIIWNIPLIYLLAPPYLILLFMTKITSEEFVNIGWDSAGVTTGPVTVPLVLALGLGLGSQTNVIESFGILAMASVYPILVVLGVCLYVTRKRKSALK